MLSNRILEQIVKGEDYLNGIEDPAQQSSIINGLRARVEVNRSVKTTLVCLLLMSAQIEPTT